ncbi:MAG: hypothetical protein EON59_11195 [Alphaproteobacteria bacterium]|nr:MAG: hypothetical protein EON59_11195 [Alphaproteobacteria bacterium]
MADTASFASNFFTARKNVTLTNVQNVPFGHAVISYQVQRFRDVADLGSRPAYLVTMSQRVVIPNATPYTPGPNQSDAYLNYPAILQAGVTITASNGPDIVLRNIFPRTLNAQVSTSQSQSNESGSTHSVQNTSGSNQSTVNSYGVSTSWGLSGTTPMFSQTSQHGQSFSSGTMQSQTNANGSSSNQNFGASQSMSIKDWSSYGMTDSSGINPGWLFGQAYPWDVLQYNQSGGSGDINLPDFVIAQLYDSGMALPPSQLSQFGIDFTMTANWLLVYNDPITADETVSFEHQIACYTASHQLSGTSTDPITATLQATSTANACSVSSPALSLSAYGLAPLTAAAVSQSTAIGFSATNWTIPPTSARGLCKVVSPGDTLQVEATGFDDTMTSDFSATTSVTLTFKVPDHNLAYTLALMHWIGAGGDPVEVAWDVNGKASGTLVVDSVQGEGAQGNASVIALRDNDFTSMSFHDYLVVGTNTVTLTMTRDGSDATAYTLHAVAIGLG